MESKRYAMSDINSIRQMFQTRMREELPGLAAATCIAIPDGFGNFKLLDIPYPPNPNRCRLGVIYRGDCFEIVFSVAEARGAAEQQIIITKDLAGAVTVVIDYLRNLVSGRIVVDIIQYRFLWFKKYYLAFFREASHRQPRRIVETFCWKVNKNESFE